MFSFNFSKRFLNSGISKTQSIQLKFFKNNFLNFTTTSSDNVNFAFHASDKPKLKIKTNAIDQSINPLNTLNYMSQKDIPFFVIKQSSLKKRAKGIKPTITTTELKYSSYKLNDACKLIRGKYIGNALELLATSNSKGAKLVKKELSEYMDRRSKQDLKKQEILIKKKDIQKLEQEKIELENLENLRNDFGKNVIEEGHDGTENKESFNLLEPGVEIKEEKSAKDFKDILKEFSDTNNTRKAKEYLPFCDYKIVEAYVGRKIGHMVPSPRAKGKVDRIYRSISKLYIYIEKVGAEKYFEQVAIGKSDYAFAADFRKLLFMNNASLKTMKAFSFITTARGRYYRKNQFERLVFFLRDKYYREKGIKLNSEIIRDRLQIQLGREMAFINPNNLSYMLATGSRDEDDRKINKQLYTKFNLIDNKSKETELKISDEVLDKSYKAREEEFNKNFRKVE